MHKEIDKEDIKRIIRIVVQIGLAIFVAVLRHSLAAAAIGFSIIPYGRCIIALIRDYDVWDYFESVACAFVISELYLVVLMYFGL